VGFTAASARGATADPSAAADSSATSAHANEPLPDACSNLHAIRTARFSSSLP